MINSYMDTQEKYNLITFNRFFTKTAKCLRDSLAAKVLIELFLNICTREIFELVFSDNVQGLYAGIYSKELKILPTNSED